MKRKIYFTISIVSLILIFAGFVLYILNEKKYEAEKVLRQQLVNKQYSGAAIEKELFDDYAKEVLEAGSENKEMTYEQYFYLSYDFYLNGNMDESLKYSHMALDKIDTCKDGFMKAYLGLLLTSNNFGVKYSDQYLSAIGKVIDTLSYKEWNENFWIILTFISNVINFDGAIDFTIDILEDLLENENKLEQNTILYFKDHLALVYMNKGNYAKALEKNMEILAIQNHGDNDVLNYIQSRSLLYMGIIYYTLGDCETAKKYLNESFNINISDEDRNYQAKISSLNNLYAVAQKENNIDEMKEVIEKYTEYINKGKPRADMYALYTIQCANYFLHINDFENAQYYIDITSKNLEEYGMGGVRALYIPHEMNKISLIYKKGDIDKACQEYEKLIEGYEGDYLFKKAMYEDLIEICKEKGDYEKLYEYSEKLNEVYNDEALMINKDYASYSVEKYEYELNMRKMNEKRIREYIGMFVFIICTSTFVIIIYMRNKSLKVQNVTDGLTKVYNRSYFNKVYSQKLKNDENFFTYIFDIDNFKSVNDTYGHVVGDTVLKEVAKTAKKAVGKQGELFRYGGEEFVVLTDEKDEMTIIKLAENIRKDIENLKWENGMHITISMGVADRKAAENDPLEEADKRLYQSKKTGKNKVTWKSA